MLSEVLAASSPLSLPNAPADRTIAQGRFDDPDRELIAASLLGADGRGGERSQGDRAYETIWRGATTTMRVCRSPRTPDSGTVVSRPTWSTEQAGRLAPGRHPVDELVWEREWRWPPGLSTSGHGRGYGSSWIGRRRAAKGSALEGVTGPPGSRYEGSRARCG